MTSLFQQKLTLLCSSTFIFLTNHFYLPGKSPLTLDHHYYSFLSGKYLDSVALKKRTSTANKNIKMMTTLSEKLGNYLILFCQALHIVFKIKILQMKSFYMFKILLKIK